MQKKFWTIFSALCLMCTVICGNVADAAVKNKEHKKGKPVLEDVRMRAEDLVRQYRMIPHEEDGAFLERHYEDRVSARPASGAIYYYLGPEQKSNFHVIDCDEYWVHNAGTPLEIWLIAADGTLTKKLLGVGLGLEPMVHIPKGTIFGAKHLACAEDGAFVTCITVPRFKYEGWRLVEKEELLTKCPAASAF